MHQGAARYVGQRVERKEDHRLLTGRGAYVDDIVAPGMLHVAFVRSPIARGRILHIDTSAAEALEGVRAVFTNEDLKRRPLNFVLVFALPQGCEPAYTPLADGRVAQVGDPVVMVVAESRYIAEDGAALVQVEYDAETPVVTMAQARDGAPVHPQFPNNVGFSIDPPPDPEVEAIFASADHVISRTVRHQRQAPVPMENRGVVASPHGENELTVWTACQSPQQTARHLALLFDLPGHAVRVIAKDVGGGFGLKVQLGREEISAIIASLLLNRPVKWIEDRLENLTAGYHAREHDMTVRLAVSADGRLLASDIDFSLNLGAWPQMIDTGWMALAMFPGPYRLPRQQHRTVSYFSNTCGLSNYRGPWMMESLARETLFDEAARAIGMDPVDFRRRNLISQEEQPYRTATGYVLDRVTPRETLELALEQIGVAAFRAEQARARLSGRYLGLGIAVYVEPTTMAQGGLMTSENAHVRIEPTGRVVAVMSTHSQGHGTATTMAQVIADGLGVRLDDVTVLEDDSSRGGFGASAGGSRQAVVGGGAAKIAAGKVQAKLKQLAAHLLNASPEHVQVHDGLITVAGVPEVASTVAEMARIAHFEPDRVPAGLELGLEAQARYRPETPIVFSNASHACIVEVDVETGVVEIKRWVACEDCGAQINPAVVEGQIAGGVAQGVGGVLMEHAAYDELGNPTSATFKDYLTPLATNVPQIEFRHLVTPSTTEGGFKGVGEGGAIIAPPTLVNAIHDALAPLGVTCFDLPLSPPRLLAAIEAARR